MVGHPIDLVKVRMQTMVIKPGEKPPFTGTFDCLKQTFRKEGVRGIYRGVSAPVTAIAPIYAVCFWGYDMGQRLVRMYEGMEDTDSNFTLNQICFAGGFSAIPTTALMAPSERIKCLLQVSPPGQYTGMVDCGVKLLKEGGIKSLYRGTGATLLRDVPGSIAWFGAYEVVKKNISEATGTPANKLNPLIVMFAGGCAGIANWCVSIPPDVIKSRYQTAPEGKYSGMVEVFTTLVKEEGPGALFKGIGPAMIRAFPANAAAFLGMESAKSLLSGMD
jgi:solute carrier family 25 carnitine/acylcarnitine transporter 20/29